MTKASQGREPVGRQTRQRDRMTYMVRRSIFRLSISLAGLFLVFCLLPASAQQDSNKRGRKFKAPPATARIEVTVLRDANGKPIENAAVVFHAMQGEKDKGNMELKTNEEGKTVIDVLPIGDTARLQIIAKGFQTFGEDYKIDKPEMAIQIRMKRPGEQYSIYKKHDETGGESKSPDASKDAPKGKPADPAKQPDAPPGQQPK